MRKKDLIKDGPVPLRMRKKGTILTGRLIETKNGTALETDIYYDRKLAARHFTWSTGYWTLLDDTWTKLMLSTILFETTLTGIGGPDMATPEYAAAVDTFALLPVYYSGAPWHTVVGYESEIARDRRDRAYTRKQDRIMTRMNAITPELPKDFLRFIRKLIKTEKNVFGVQLYQKIEDGYMERQFRVRQTGSGLIITEDVRGMAKDLGGWWDEYYYGQSFTYGDKQTFWDKKNMYVINNLMRRFYLYTGNLGETDLTDKEINIINSLIKVSPKCEWSGILRKYKSGSREILETVNHLMVKGLTKAAGEYAKNCIDHRMINENAKTAADFFKITPQQLAYMKEAGGGWRSVLMLQHDPDRRLRAETLKKFEGIINSKNYHIWADMLDRHLNIDHIYTLLAKNNRIKAQDLSEYRDYLDMARQKGSDIRDEIIYRNKRWKEYHDRYAAELQELRALQAANRRREECRKQAKKFVGIKKDYKLNCQLFKWEKDGYCIEVPRSYDDIITEGQLQHHCVGASDRYMEQMAKRESFILFLRKQDSKDTPYYTIEATTDRVIQFYAAYDRQPDKKEVQKILTAWMADVRKRAKGVA